ncbi:unnamed protein product, partial [Ixodes hexagonus]
MTETLTTAEQRRAMFSNYKGCHIVKFLVAIAPNGAICFISEAYGGRATDSFTTVDSRFLYVVQRGDLILNDKGSPQIKSDVEQKHAVLVMPPFSSGDPQFTVEQMNETYNVAQVRVHVERMIQITKVYDILNNRLPIKLIPHSSKMFHMLRPCQLAATCHE